MTWAATEFETLDLGDARRNQRAIRLMDSLSANPSASIPQACGDWADIMALLVRASDLGNPAKWCNKSGLSV